MRSTSGGVKPTANSWLFLGLLGVALLFLFYKSLDPHQILFANDVPLGARKSEFNTLPGRFTGTWGNLSWLGGESPAASPSITMLMATVVSPVLFLKIYPPFTLLFLGFSAWLFFRQLRFGPVVCALGGVAAALNSHFLSNACWGLGNWNLSAGCTFLALAALHARGIPRVWERAVMAGLAVGMAVMEGYDVGAIFSICIGVYIVFRFFNDEGSVSAKVVNMAVAEVLVVLFAGFIAWHTMHTLVETEVEGVAAMGQDAETKQTRWRSATQWSLPKMETLQIMVPGLFGYRLTGNITQKDHSGAYWGQVGQDPRLTRLGSDDPNERAKVISELNLPDSYLPSLNTPDRHSRTAGMMAIQKKSGIYWRYTGSGECAGAIVSLLALFGMANFFRKDHPFSKAERMALGFWIAAAIFSLVAAWGRFGFIYQFLYKLPYVSTIRNPIKFLHPFHIAWVILAAYGIEVLYRRYMSGPDRSSGDLLPQHLSTWWGKATGFDRKWTVFMMALAGVAAAGAILMFLCRTDLIHYLEDQAFASALAANKADAMHIADSSIQMAAIFVAFLFAEILVIAAIISGAWSGPKQTLGWVVLAILMTCDLVRADVPWVHYYDYAEKYELNPVTEFLIDKPWEHRVIGKLEPRGPGSGITPGFGQLYFFWLQNDFPYHNIQTLDFAQMSHMPDLDRLYLKNFELNGADIRTTDLRPAVRLWQLTNTRYVLATASAVEFLNQRADTAHHSFKLDGLFSIVRKPDIESVDDVGDLTVKSGPKGDFGIIDYPEALPRAKLFSSWNTTNDTSTLAVLADPNFDPWKTVLVATNTPLAQPDSTATADPGTVTITDYHPKKIHLDADARTASVLLLNDRFNSDWRVLVDNEQKPLLRCNYIMRGVYLTPGHHHVEFIFRPSIRSLYISVSAIIVGILLAGYLIIARKSDPAATGPTAPRPVAPAPSPLPEPVRRNVTVSAAKGQKGNAKAKR